MRESHDFEYPERQRQLLHKARRLECWIVAYVISDTILLYFVMGASQAMKANWVEDLLAFAPPIVFLIATPIARWKPNHRFPYGYHRSASIAFLTAAVALLGFGVYLLIDGIIPWLHAEHPTIGSVTLFGETTWLGWLMLPALVWSGAPPFFFGRAEMPLALSLHDEVLYTSAKMNKAGWMSSVAGVLGVLGIGLGYWWADYAAATVISLDVIHDGYTSLRRAVLSLMNEIPKTTDQSRIDPLIDRVRERLEGWDWVRQADVRLREEGHVYFGEAFVVPTSDEVRTETLHRATQEIADLDWKLHDITIVPVRSLPADSAPNPEQCD